MRLRGAAINSQGQVVSRRAARLEGRKEALALRQLPVFAGCRLVELQLIDRLMCEVAVPAGRVLIREGLPVEQTFVVVSGRARVTRSGEVLGTAEPGASFGGRELHSRTPSPVTITAETPMVVRAAGAREFRSLFDAIPLPALVAPPVIRRGTLADEIEAFLQYHSARGCDRVLAAVMFTDMVGQDSIVANEVWRHGGTMVILGDGALARVECANSAVQCALAVRDTVHDLGIDMRAGLHAGEVELRGSDISGAAVRVASRICGVAGSGRVLASRPLVELVAGTDLVFEDAGTHSLTGVGGEWPLLAVTG